MPGFLIELSAALQQNNGLFIGFSVVLGLLIGSFLNVVIHRLPKMMEREWQIASLETLGMESAPGQPAVMQTKYNLVTPRSGCPNCGHMITAMENIPVLSYLFLRGKCSGCKTPISVRYPLVETLTGVLLGLVAWKYGYTGATFMLSILVIGLIALTFIDFDTMLLPDDIVYPILWLGLLFNLNGGLASLNHAVIGAIAGYMSLWSIYWLFKIVTGKEGMGYGDFKLLAALGAWFGVAMLPAIIILSAVLGALIGIGLMVLTKRGREVPMPFGPFLAIGGIAALFFGQQLSGMYM